MEYKIIQSHGRNKLTEEINENANCGWRLVNAVQYVKAHNGANIFTATLSRKLTK